MNCISGNDLVFYYRKQQPVIDHIDISIKKGKFTGIIGKNGCGKSTLLKLLIGLLPLHAGNIAVNGLDINTKDGMNYLRMHCGIVFQNPDNQFVSPIIEDDIHFGLDNHKIPREEYDIRVKDSLNRVNLAGFEKRNVSTLSGGQKQRAAMAGILAIEPDILIFDEATSMLDPDGKSDLKQCIENVLDGNNTVIVITQNVCDVIHADEIILINEHKIIAQGTPHEVLTDYDILKNAGVQIPFPVQVFHDLKMNGINLPYCPLTDEEFKEAICSLN